MVSPEGAFGRPPPAVHPPAGYDYAAAEAHFVTIAAQDRKCLFGQVVDGEMRLNEAGHMVEGQWLALAGRFPTVDLDEFVVMPNHFHGIILLEPPAYAADGSDGGRAAMDRATACDAAPSVGATLVVAQNAVAPDMVARNCVARDGMNPAPTERPAMDRANACDAAPAVGATLVVAQNAVAQNAVAPDMVARNCVAPDGMARPDGNRAGTSPAPTAHLAMDRANACDVAPSVGATLVVARCVVARCAVAQNAIATDRAPTLGAVVGAFKSITTQAYMDGVRQSGWPPFVGRLWQRNYYEHIIRSEKSLDRIREYVAGNPVRWAEDRENPAEVDNPTSARRIAQPWET